MDVRDGLFFMRTNVLKKGLLDLVRSHLLTANSRGRFGGRMCLNRNGHQRNTAVKLHRLIRFMICSYSLPPQIVRHLHHFIRSLNCLGIDFVAPLRDNHIDHLFRQVHIRAFQETLLDCTEPRGKPGMPWVGGPEAKLSKNRLFPTATKPAGYQSA